MLYVLGYIAVINIIGFILMGVDKWKAKKNRWRISEKDLFTLAAIGGSIGIIGGMKAFHHKTLHKKFKYGIPFMLLSNIVMIAFITYLLYTNNII